MADYYSQCVVTPMLPLADLTAAEQLILEAVFESEVDGDELYLFSDGGRCHTINPHRGEIEQALAATPEPSSATRLLSDALASASVDREMLDIDVEDAWIGIFQDLIRRDNAVTHVAIETAWTCSKMRPDGFGGSAMLITAEAVDTMSTSQFIDETLAALRAA